MKSRVIAVALIERDDQILLGRKPDGVGPYPNTWHIPGGGINLGEESLLEAVRREVKEETGLEVSDIKRMSFDEDYEPDKHGEMTHYIFLRFRMKAKGKKQQAADDLIRLEWFKKSDVKKLALNRATVKYLKEIGML